tara:strand:+ start:60 stop:233 length:174 start_codon:yes stop_codon:yes gene_type:complete
MKSLNIAVVGYGLVGKKHCEIISEIWMFIGVLIIALVIMILFPELILWLPDMFGYKG